jgi:molecular chaperone DnaJ
MAADFYKTLGVKRTATADEIRMAYRKLARRYHPDTNPDDPKAEDKFKALSQAYDTLKDPKRRAAYDQPQPAEQSSWRPASGRSANFSVDDLMDAMGHSQPYTRERAVRGDDVLVDAEISFEDAFAGTTLRVGIERPVTCTVCAGSGAQPPTQPKRCPTCRGSGEITASQGLFALTEPCPQCFGRGLITEHPCKKCLGTGHEVKIVHHDVRVPAGVKNRSTLRKRGRGLPGSAGGPGGDLLIKLHLTSTNGFEREGDDFTVDLPISIADAALGAEARVRLPEGGTARVKVPPGSAEGKLLRLRGRGAPRTGGDGRGDLRARVRLQVPAHLSAKQAEALEAYRRASDGV